MNRCFLTVIAVVSVVLLTACSSTEQQSENYEITRENAAELAVLYDQAFQATVDCLRDKGWVVTDVDMTLHSYTLQDSAGQEDAAFADDDACQTETGLNKFGTESTREIEEFYYYNTEIVVPCLEEHGYQIEQAPSLEQYIQDYPDTWGPYDSIAGSFSTQEEWDQINRECPQSMLQYYSPSRNADSQ